MQKIRNRKIIHIIAFMMISLCRTAFLGAQLPANGLIAYYSLNGNANDESGNGNNPIGQLYNPASDRCGFSSSAYKSDNSNYIYLPPANFTGLSEYSYSLWFRADSLPNLDYWILFSAGSPVEDYEQVLSIYSGGNLIGTGSNGETNPTLSTVSTDPVQAGRWIHVVLTRDNTRMRMFLNGAQINISDPNSLTHDLPANYGPDPKATIGCQFGESRYNFLGAIDEVRIYDRVLTEEEIEQLYYTECTLSELVGPTEVCQGQQNVTYFVDPLDNVSNNEWSYSGTGVTINGNGNQITINFADNATSGTLSVTVTGDFIDVQTRSIAIQVQKLPSDAGILNGENTVCLNQIDVLYSVPSIELATSYLWEYSGTGAALTMDTNTVVMDFSDQATSGNLTVTGHNNCGDGARSPEFFITVSDCSVAPAEITIPNSFTPNGDGVNDVFHIQGLPENSTLIIFDRAGHKLFESFSYTNDWDGKDRGGKALNSGTYWYVLSVPGQPEEHKGFVYLKQ